MRARARRAPGRLAWPLCAPQRRPAPEAAPCSSPACPAAHAPLATPPTPPPLRRAEEDKTTDTAIEYWFRCADLDCDGRVTPSEMWHFYEEQMKRLEAMNQVRRQGRRGAWDGAWRAAMRLRCHMRRDAATGPGATAHCSRPPAAHPPPPALPSPNPTARPRPQEPVLFEDVLCQLHDMLQPGSEGAYTLADAKRARPQSALLFNTLFNLHKFLAFENRDPFALRAESMGEDGQTLSEWDRCAAPERAPGAGQTGRGTGQAWARFLVCAGPHWGGRNSLAPPPTAVLSCPRPRALASPLPLLPWHTRSRSRSPNLGLPAPSTCAWRWRTSPTRCRWTAATTAGPARAPTPRPWTRPRRARERARVRPRAPSCERARLANKHDHHRHHVRAHARAPAPAPQSKHPSQPLNTQHWHASNPLALAATRNCRC